MVVSRWVWAALFLVGVFVLLVGAYLVWRYLLTSTPPNPCGNLPGSWVRPNCWWVNERYADSTIPAPTQQVYLGAFSEDPSLPGGPLCTPMWYAFRYVRISDGGYSSLSPWSGTIYAGAPTLPCAPSGSCGQGSNTCTFNRPTLVTIETLPFTVADGYLLNLHRQTGTFDPNSEGQIVGNLILVPSSLGTSFWSDVNYNPNLPGVTCPGC